MADGWADCWSFFVRDPREETFAPFYARSRALIYSICFRMLGNPDEAQDAFQATYGRLLGIARGTRTAQSIELNPRLVGRIAAREAGRLRARRRRLAQKEITVDELPPAADPRPRAQFGALT